MKIRDVADVPENDKKLKITLALSPAESEAFFQALHAGKLDSLGITVEKVSVEKHREMSGRVQHAERRSRRDAPDQSHQR